MGHGGGRAGFDDARHGPVPCKRGTGVCRRHTLMGLTPQLWTPPKIDSWDQRAEVSPLNDAGSMSVAGGYRKIYQGFGDINI